MAALSLLLQALKYPRVHGFSVADPTHFQAAVVWLENTKVRRYPIEGRGALSSEDSATWQPAVQQYLTDLGCPLSLEGGNHRAVLQWLLGHAVGLEYQDSAQPLTQLAQQVEAEAAPPEDWSEAQLPPLPDIKEEAVKSALVQLQQLLHVEGGSSGGGAAAAAAAAAEATPEALLKAHAMLEACVLPALAELAKRRQQTSSTAAAAAEGEAATSGGGVNAAAGAASQQHAAVAAMLAQYPLGFSTGDAGADLASTILRMLYIKDLRALQTLVDSAIVQVQEYTANPRTDSSLGRVGH